MNKRKFVRDDETQLVYASEIDGNGNVVKIAGPLPWHEVGRVLLERYTMTERGAADLNGRAHSFMTVDEQRAIARGYDNRQGLPVLDGTIQDQTQPIGRPGVVGGENPSTFADKGDPADLPQSEITDHPEIVLADQDDMAAREQGKKSADEIDTGAQAQAEIDNGANADEMTRRGENENETSEDPERGEPVGDDKVKAGEGRREAHDTPGSTPPLTTSDDNAETHGSSPPATEAQSPMADTMAVRADQLPGVTGDVREGQTETADDDPRNPEAREKSGATREGEEQPGPRNTGKGAEGQDNQGTSSRQTDKARKASDPKEKADGTRADDKTAMPPKK